MRALLPIATSIKDLRGHAVDLRQVIKDNNWLVSDDTKARAILESVLADMPPTDQERVREQYVLSLGRENAPAEGIIGIVDDEDTIEIRLIASASPEIKAACSDIVQILVESDRDPARPGMHFGFKFNFHASIYSRNTREKVWEGTVQPRGALYHAWREERAQAHVVMWGTAIFVLGFAVTFPALAHRLLPGLDKEVYDWISGFVGRVSSAALFAVIVAGLNIQLKAQEFRRDGAVYWKHV